MTAWSAALELVAAAHLPASQASRVQRFYFLRAACFEFYLLCAGLSCFKFYSFAHAAANEGLGALPLCRRPALVEVLMGLLQLLPSVCELDVAFHVLNDKWLFLRRERRVVSVAQRVSHGPAGSSCSTLDATTAFACLPDSDDHLTYSSVRMSADSDREDDKAKEAYRTGDYAAAVKAWTRSLSSVKYLLEKDLYKHNPAQEKEVEGMELRLCLNLAQVHLKLSEWGQAVTFADKALVRDARNAKALYRKASALMELMSYSEAIEVLGRLLEFERSNSAAVAMLAKANRSASLSEVRERRQAKKIFAGIERDSRVPPTEWEVFVDSVREAVADCFGQLEGKLGVRCPCRRSRSRAPGVDGDKKD
ncbi:unnamed protein product [Polarella glacialis]|uniref:peptidylprolyl isomerase n=1 Tax=Polarella glacialis TaxID=89957 RepID=A0A813HZ58_POLGL|nr:unnamed protein product [Polarella glacialis]